MLCRKEHFIKEMPVDSVTQIRSAVSKFSTPSEKSSSVVSHTEKITKSVRKKASLASEIAFLEHQHKIATQELQLMQLKEEFNLRMEMERQKQWKRHTVIIYKSSTNQIQDLCQN